MASHSRTHSSWMPCQAAVFLLKISSKLQIHYQIGREGYFGSLSKHLARTQQQWWTLSNSHQQSCSVLSSWKGRATIPIAPLHFCLSGHNKQYTSTICTQDECAEVQNHQFMNWRFLKVSSESQAAFWKGSLQGNLKFNVISKKQFSRERLKNIMK